MSIIKSLQIISSSSRSPTSNIIGRRKELTAALIQSPNNHSLLLIPIRNQTGYSYIGGGYFNSRLYDKNKGNYTKVEKSFNEFKFVEKLIPPVYVPQAPTDPTIEYPSGWKPPSINRENCPLPYYIPRTKNYMSPIYLFVHQPTRGIIRRTEICNVEGNIWALEKDIVSFLHEKYPYKTIISWVNECWRKVIIRGEYVDPIKEWALEKGF